MQTVADRISAHTLVTYSRAHGTQIEYKSPDGGAFLWYPGNRYVVPGRWKLRTFANASGVPQVEVCHRYGLNTFNPVTGMRGGSFVCSPYEMRPDDVLLPGDPFGLAVGGEVPARIDRGRYTPEELAAMAAAS